MPAQPVSAGLRLDWRWWLLVWILAGAVLIYRSQITNAGAPFFGDTDDAMRMVMARDLLNGQGWYDLVQHRLNTPLGAEIHWSRLVDLPLALLLGLLTPLLGPDGALVGAGVAWPVLLLGVMLWLSARISIELVGPEGALPALVLPVLSPAILAEFSPGRVDHHNIIIVLTLACLWASLVSLRRPGFAWAAGLFAASALAVAIEALPLVVATIMVFGLVWVFQPARASAMRWFGLSFAASSMAHLAVARPPHRWLEAACDMISPVYVLAALAVGAAYLAASLLPQQRLAWTRLAILAALGSLAAGVIVVLFPQCLAGPYGELDPWLQTYWIGTIVEAKPWHSSVLDLPAYTIAVGAPVLLGLAIGVFAWRLDGDRRLGWIVALVFLLLAGLTMLMQIRGARLAILPAMPMAAWLIVRARHAYLARSNAATVLALVGSWLAFSGVILAVLVSLATRLVPAERAELVETVRASKQACLAPSAFTDLAGLPPERIMTPIDLGSHMLVYTPHAVVAAPYHRNEDGVLDAFRFFNRPPEDARAIAVERGLGLVVTCPTMPEMRGVGARDPLSLVNLLAADTPPDWLTEIDYGGPLRIYAIMP